MKIEIEIADEMWNALARAAQVMPSLGASPEELIRKALEPALRTYGERFIELPPAIEALKRQLDEYMQSVGTPAIRRSK